MEYAVKVETHEGNVMTLRRGFASEEEAEDYPVQLSMWKRAWVELLPSPVPEPPPALPPMPWTSDFVDGGYGGKTSFAYIKDANGRRIMSLLGHSGEKDKMAEFICSAANQMAGKS